MNKPDDTKKELATMNIVMPQVSPDEAVKAWKEYQDLKTKVVDKDVDIQKIEGKDFLKKSYWRKIATFFNLTVDVLEERRELLGKTMAWHFTLKATAPNGRSAIGTGAWGAFERATLINGIYMSWDKF